MSRGLGDVYKRQFIRNVKKPNGSKPGMVIFTNNYTITVKPDTELEEKLRV